MDQKLNGKADSIHIHVKDDITDFPIEMKNSFPLWVTIRYYDGTSETKSYDGSYESDFSILDTGGYLSSEIKNWVNNTFTPGLEQRLGINLYPLSKLHSTKSSSAWADYKVWIPSEIEIAGKVKY